MVDIQERRDEIARATSAREPARSRQPISREVVSGTVQIFDFIAVLIGGLSAFWIYFYTVLGDAADFSRYSLTTCFAGLIFTIAMRRTNSYDFKRLGHLGTQLGQVSALWAATISTLATAAFVTKVAEVYSRGWAISFALMVFAELIASRVFVRVLFRQWRTQGRLTRSVAIVGAGPAGEELVAKLQQHTQNEIEIVGIFDDRLTRVPSSLAGFPVLGTTAHLIELGQLRHIDEIVIALPLRAAERIGEIVTKLRLLPIDLRLSIDPIAGAFPIRGIGNLASSPMIEILDRPLKHWSGLAKWLEDRVFGTIALLLAAPFMALIAVVIYLDSRGPIFFMQDRFGFNNQPFRIFKFRTMHVAKSDPTGEQRTVPNDPRVTRVGRVLRRLSLDELPQLFNVMRGEMSLVGPRAHAVAMKAGDRLYQEAVKEYFQRHRVRPGITGWAQANGSRGEISSIESAKRRVALDLYYIENWSLWLDIRILVRTGWVLILRKNAY